MCVCVCLYLSVLFFSLLSSRALFLEFAHRDTYASVTHRRTHVRAEAKQSDPRSVSRKLWGYADEAFGRNVKEREDSEGEGTREIGRQLLMGRHVTGLTTGLPSLT